MGENRRGSQLQWEMLYRRGLTGIAPTLEGTLSASIDGITAAVGDTLSARIDRDYSCSEGTLSASQIGSEEWWFGIGSTVARYVNTEQTIDRVRADLAVLVYAAVDM